MSCQLYATTSCIFNCEACEYALRNDPTPEQRADAYELKEGYIPDVIYGIDGFPYLNNGYSCPPDLLP